MPTGTDGDRVSQLFKSIQVERSTAAWVVHIRVLDPNPLPLNTVLMSPNDCIKKGRKEYIKRFHQTVVSFFMKKVSVV